MPPKSKKGAEVKNDAGAAKFGRVKNTLAMGFVGLPNVGKSSLTNLMSKSLHAEAANYPFCTIDPNMVQVIVPDQKFQYLVDTFKPASVVPAALKLTDIAGLIKGASTGAGLGNAFLSHIAAVDGIYHLVRGFIDSDIVHVDDTVDPARDLETIQGELCAKDLETLDKVLEAQKEKIRKEKGKSRGSEVELGEAFQTSYDICKKLLESNTFVQSYADFTATQVDIIKEWSLLTTKPVIYVVNLSQKSFIAKGNKFLPKIKTWVDEHGGGTILPVSVEFEQNLADAEDKDAFLKECTEKAKDAGLTGPQANVKSMIPRLIRAGRQALNLQSFYTAGPKEVRAWTIMGGTLAPQAAGVIHTDFERGFIKAEVANFDDFKAHHGGLASMAKVKEAGKYRQEGKQYTMQEGDICVFMHNTTNAKKK